MTTRTQARVLGPKKPDEAAPHSFPVVASIAPVVVSVAMWLVTQSPFALVFAALGPVVAIASLADSRIQARRKSRSEAARFAAELQRAILEVAAAHDSERAALDELTPGGRAIVELGPVDTGRWSTDASMLAISLGRGVVASSLSIEGIERSRSASEHDAAIDELSRLASALLDAPIVADARLGVGVCGPWTAARAVARGLLVQLARSLSPAGYWWAASESAAGSEREWLDALPHPRGATLPGELAVVAFGAIGTDEPIAIVAVAAGPDDLSTGQRIAVRAGEQGGEVVAHPDRGARGAIALELVSAEQALSWAELVRACAARDGLIADTGGIPATAQLSELLETTGAGLACTPVVGSTGPVEIDLVSHGPHAIVGGATGSGKSEFLISWVLAMAAAHSPADVTFLLVDFKGGSAFAPIRQLPHIVGVVTDLDEPVAGRALESLRAEVRHRERALAAAGVRDVAGSGLPRLVVVVDEFAAMLTDFPELHALFSDIASRGRSLGIHLILCTQRPAVAARDGVLANADLRVSLRVNNRTDSVAVVGTDAAATLSARDSGRAVLSVHGESSLVQAALSAPGDAETVAGLWPGPWRPRRPWCEPLSERIQVQALPAGAFGLLDLPGDQRQDPAFYDAPARGSVVVLGASRSGKSTALAALAAAHGRVLVVPQDPTGAWLVIAGSAPRPGSLVVLDDLDSLMARFGEEHRAAFAERLTGVLRDGPSRGIHVLASAQRVSGEVQQLVTMFPARLLLGQSSKQEHLLAGGDPATYRASACPGRGDWLGAEVQVAWGAKPLAAPATAEPPQLPGARPLAVVSATPKAAAQRLASCYSVVGLDECSADPRELVMASGKPAAIVGDPEQWQSRWGALGSLRSSADIAFHGCSIQEFRSLSGSRRLPPPIEPGSGVCWVLTGEQAVRLVSLPHSRDGLAEYRSEV